MRSSSPDATPGTKSALPVSRTDQETRDTNQPFPPASTDPPEEWSPPTKPTGSPFSRRRLVVFCLASLLALLVGGVAPEAWPEGEGRIEIRDRSKTLFSEPVMLGSEEAQLLSSPGPNSPNGPATTSLPGLTLQVELPYGTPVDRPVEVALAVAQDGRPLRPDLDSFGIFLVLPDGTEERIPILGWDKETKTLQGARRPPDGAEKVLALLTFVVVMWVSEAFPLHVTSLAIPTVLALSHTGEAETVLAPFFHPIIVLFFAGFLMAEAMRRVGLDRVAAIVFVSAAGRTPRSLFAALLGASAFASMWMSNTASVALLLPVALAITAPLHNTKYTKMVVLGVAYAATIGGVGSAIGTPANPLAIEFLGTFAEKEISFLDWFAFGLPFVFCFLPLAGIYLWQRFRPQVNRENFAAAREETKAARAALERFSAAQWQVLAVFCGVAFLWVTQEWHGQNTGIVALAGSILLMGFGHVRTEDLGIISWPTLLTFGGGLTLGLALTDSGTADWLVTRLALLDNLTPLIFLLAVGIATVALTAVASNTAAAAMLVPLAVPLAGVVGTNPVTLVLVVAIASSVDFALVVGTPPTMLAYGTGLFTSQEIFRKGILLDFAGVFLLATVVTGIWGILELV